MIRQRRGMGILKMEAEAEGLQKLNYGTDITMLAETGKLDPVIGRDKEVEVVIEALSKRRNSNACLVGDAGVGKTAIVHALATKIAANSVPPLLSRNRVYSIEIGDLMDGAIQRGDFEKRVRCVLEQVRASKGLVILFIDNFMKADTDTHTQLATILKFALPTHHFKCIVAIRVEEYTRYMQRDGELNNMFETVQVREPSRDDCIQMLDGIIHKYRNHHAQVYPRNVYISAVDLSNHYISEGVLPGKAINLLDKAGARARMLGNSSVTEAEIGNVISTSRGWSAHGNSIPLGLENVLKRSIIGQDEAVEAVSRAICRAHAGLRDETKPIGCFLITGPTGVGKTEIAKVVARDYFKSKAAMVSLEMRQFMESDTVDTLTELLTDKVRTRPHCLLLFEDIEKAHERILNVLLHILDYGSLSNDYYSGSCRGETRVDFTNTIVIATSTSNEECKMRAEVLNRFDQVVALKPLEKEHIENILENIIDELDAKVVAKKKHKRVFVCNKLKELLVSMGFDKRCGARLIKRLFSNYVETKLAEAFGWRMLDSYSKVIADVNPNTGRIYWRKFIDRVDPESNTSVSVNDKRKWHPPSDIFIPLIEDVDE